MARARHIHVGSAISIGVTGCDMEKVSPSELARQVKGALAFTIGEICPRRTCECLAFSSGEIDASRDLLVVLQVTDLQCLGLQLCSIRVACMD